MFVLTHNTGNQLNGSTSSKQSNHTTRNSPTTHPQGQANESVSSTPKMNGHRGIVPLPILLIDGQNPISPTDHDYEELASQRNSINEQHMSIVRTMSGNGLTPKFTGHRPRNYSMPIIVKKERRPVVEHDYDEPICIRKPVYQNGFLVVKHAQSRPKLIRGQSSPAKQSRPVTVLGPKRGGGVQNSKTKDYEVPVSSAADSVVEEASSTIANLKPSPPPDSLRRNKAKSMRVAKQGHSDEAMMYRSGSVGMESRIRDQIQARKCLPNSTGSSPTNQGDVVC